MSERQASPDLRVPSSIMEKIDEFERSIFQAGRAAARGSRQEIGEHGYSAERFRNVVLFCIAQALKEASCTGAGLDPKPVAWLVDRGAGERVMVLRRERDMKAARTRYPEAKITSLYVAGEA